MSGKTWRRVVGNFWDVSGKLHGKFLENPGKCPRGSWGMGRKLPSSQTRNRYVLLDLEKHFLLFFCFLLNLGMEVGIFLEVVIVLERVWGNSGTCLGNFWNVSGTFPGHV